MTEKGANVDLETCWMTCWMQLIYECCLSGDQMLADYAGSWPEIDLVTLQYSYAGRDIADELVFSGYLIDSVDGACYPVIHRYLL